MCELFECIQVDATQSDIEVGLAKNTEMGSTACAVVNELATHQRFFVLTKKSENSIKVIE